MSRFAVVALLLLVLAFAGTVAWLATREPEPEYVTVAAAPAVVPQVGTRNAQDPPRRPRAQGGNRFVARGAGTVVGSVREYGTDRPLAGVAVSLVAGSPGPDRTIEATTSADGTFTVPEADAFDAWTLRAKAPPPLGDAEVASVAVSAGKTTDVGVLYLAPAFEVPGIVVDERGAPVEGADVLAVRRRPDPGRLDVVRMLREITERPAAADRAVTGKDGRFRLTKLVPGAYDLGAQRTGFANRVEPGVVVTPGAAEIRLVVRKGVAIEGRVVRREGGPVAGATVVAIPDPKGPRVIDPLTKSFATTGADGKFRVEGLLRGRHVVAAVPEGEPAVVADRVDVPQSEPLEITVEGDAALEGRVTGPDDRPVAAAQVLAISERMKTFGTAASDADGRYAIRGLRSGGEVVLLVHADGFAPFPADLEAAKSGREGTVQLAPGTNTRDVKLLAGAVVRGTVKDRADGRGVAGARVDLRIAQGELGAERTATTDAEGRYSVRGVHPGKHVVAVTKPGWYQPGLAASGTPAEIEVIERTVESGRTSTSSAPIPAVEVAEGATTVEYDPEIAASGWLRGRVTTPDGPGAPGARVVLEPASGRPGPFQTALVDTEPRLTSEDGSFALPAPPPGVRARVVASASGFAPGRSDFVEGKGGEDVPVADVRLRRAAMLEGRVTDGDGRGIDGAEVRYFAQGTGSRDARTTSTDADGRWRAEGLEPSSFGVQVLHPRFLPWSAKALIEVAEGATVTVDAVLTLGAVVSGVVLGPDGDPVSGATVSLLADGRPGGLERTDARPPVLSLADGTFRAEGLPPGAYFVNARAPGFVPGGTVEVTAPADNVTLRVAQAFSISGVAKVRGGAPLADVEVSVRAAGGTRGGTVARVRTGSDGKFELKGLAAGPYDVRVDPETSRGPRLNVLPGTAPNVAAGAADVVVELEPGLVISGTVFLSDGTPAKTGRVNCEIPRRRTGTGGGGARPPRVDGDRGNAAIAAGAFEVVGLCAGTFEVLVRVEGHAPKTVEAAAGATGIRIDLTAGGSLRGRVLLADGSPAAGATVTAMGGNSSGGTKADAQGRYEILHLAEGTGYVLQVNVSAPGKVQSGNADGLAVREGAATDVPDVTCRLVQAPEGPPPPPTPPRPK